MPAEQDARFSNVLDLILRLGLSLRPEKIMLLCGSEVYVGRFNFGVLVSCHRKGSVAVLTLVDTPKQAIPRSGAYTISLVDCADKVRTRNVAFFDYLPYMSMSPSQVMSRILQCRGLGGAVPALDVLKQADSAC